VEVRPRKELPPVTVQTEVLEQPSVPTVAPSKPSAAQNPYSVYLGSFKAPDAVKKALSDYQEKGLSAYWVRVDLGDKGVWYRFFAGYFRTKEEAEKFIKERNLQGATPGVTKFANFIGRYDSDKEAEDRKRALLAAGFYPYVIKDAEGRFLLYSGAFDRREYAEKERSDLASKGIKSEVVER
jgi:cell division protein FtsN